MGQNPAQEVRQTVPALVTPPPPGVPPHPPNISRSNSPLLRCPAHRGFPIGSRGSRTQGAGRGAPASGRGRQLLGVGRRIICAPTHPRPNPLPTPPPPQVRAHSRPKARARTHISLPQYHRPPKPDFSLDPDNPVTRYVSPPVCTAAPATRHPLPGAPPPPPQPIRGAAALEPANPGAREVPRGRCIILSPRPPRPRPLGPVDPALENPHPATPSPGSGPLPTRTRTALEDRERRGRGGSSRVLKERPWASAPLVGPCSLNTDAALAR